MVGVDTSKLALFDGALAKIAEEFPHKRREFIVGIGELLKSEIDTSVERSGINDGNGKVRRWQVSHLGSGGGYAAIRPEKGKTGRNSPGAITNYLEGGHAIRGPSGSDPTYRPRIRVVRAPAFHIYENARISAEAIAIQQAEAFADEIAAMMEG